MFNWYVVYLPCNQMGIPREIWKSYGMLITRGWVARGDVNGESFDILYDYLKGCVITQIESGHDKIILADGVRIREIYKTNFE